MEKVYQKTRMNTGASARIKRRRTQEKPLFSAKKLVVQTIVSIIVFSFVYSMRFVNTPFSERVMNEALYTTNYTIDLQSLYKSSREIFAYLTGTIEQGKSYIDSAVLQVQNPNVQGDEGDIKTENTSYSADEQNGEAQ